MSAKHTPGPWILNIDTAHIPRHVNGVSVKVQPAAFHGDSQGMADARLIAAAPLMHSELTAAAVSLQSIADMIDEAINTKIRTGRLPNVAPLLQTILDTAAQQAVDARAALAKAEGSA